MLDAAPHFTAAWTCDSVEGYYNSLCYSATFAMEAMIGMLILPQQPWEYM
jgi:hypothetical protein